MSANTKALRIRIRSVDSTKHLTKAMELVASSKIRKAGEAMQKSKAYKNALQEVMHSLTASRECERSPFMAHRGERTKMIVIAGDRGLAGGYNANVFRLCRQHPDASVLPIGKRACERFHADPVLCETFTGQDAHALARQLCTEYLNGGFDRLTILYTRYDSMLSQTAVLLPVLPLEKPRSSKTVSCLFEPSEEAVLNAAVQEYVSGVIAACVHESFASEVAARRFAMDNAGKNATTMIDDLQLKYNRARQGAITQEITEIVAGSGS